MSAVTLVTGATSGIGRATAVLLARAGHRVVLAGRRGVLGEAIAQELRDAGGDAHFVACDVTKPGDIDHLMAAIIARHTRLDVVVNNAATYVAGTLEDTPPEVWARVLDVNLGSVYRVSRAAIPHLRRAGGGSIVNIASVHAFATQPKVAAYAASKGAIVALTRQMAIDLAPDRIRVNCVAVGGVDTPMAAESFRLAGTTAEAAGWTDDPRVLGRMGHPEEIAEAIGFLASEAASFVTGSVLAADGGLLAAL